MTRQRTPFHLLIALACLTVWTESARIDTARAETPIKYSDPQLLKESTAHFSGPADLTISPDGGYLLVTDTGNNVIKVLQPGTLNVLAQFGEALIAPTTIEFSANGDLLVADDGFRRVTTYEFKGVFRDGSANVKQLNVRKISSQRPAGANSATDSSGQSYVINPEENQIVILDKNRKRIGTFGTDLLKAPNAVETVGRYFWVADTGNNRILLVKAPRSVAP